MLSTDTGLEILGLLGMPVMALSPAMSMTSSNESKI